MWGIETYGESAAFFEIELPRPRARDSLDQTAVQIEQANAVIISIGNKKIASSINGNPLRRIELRLRARTAIACKSVLSHSRNSRNNTAGIDFANAVIIRIRNIDIATR